VNHGSLPIFPNLNSLDTTLKFVGLNGWKDLLFALQFFPNLNHLKVSMEHDRPLDLEEHNNWYAPDYVPDCLVRKLKKLELMMTLKMTDNNLKLLAYILSKALVLEKLCISCRHKGRSAKDQLWNALNFCCSLFKLPRGTSTCEIEISDAYIKASSNDFKRWTPYMSIVY
ncbi:hypothetical protein RDABS01_038431, partial [Bienertia sinuspersici]